MLMPALLTTTSRRRCCCSISAHQRGDVLAARDIDRHRRAPRPLRDEPGRRLLAALAIDVGDVDVRALGGEQLRRGQPDAGGRAGDERDLVLQPRHSNSRNLPVRFQQAASVGAIHFSRMVTSSSADGRVQRHGRVEVRLGGAEPQGDGRHLDDLGCVLAEHVAADDLADSAVDDELHEHALVAPRQRRLHRAERGLVDVELAAALSRQMLGETDAGDLGRREHGRRDERVLDHARLAAELGVGEGVPLADGDRRQGRAVRDVADGEDAVDRRLRILVDDDVAVPAELDADLVEAEPGVFGVRPMANMICSAVSDVPFDEMPDEPGAGLLEAREDVPGDDADALLDVGLGQTVAQILVEAAQDLVAAIDDRRLDAEVARRCRRTPWRCSRRRR